MSKCMYGHFKCRDCDQKESCNANRTMIDSSIILNMIKHENNCDICEDKFNQVLREGRGFITHIILAEVYKETIKFIYEEIERRDLNNFTVEALSKLHKEKLILEIINELDNILEKLYIKELDKTALEYALKLFNLPRIDMGDRDKIILGIAESHIHKQFLFIDSGIKSAEKSIREIGFNINLEHLNLKRNRI